MGLFVKLVSHYCISTSLLILILSIFLINKKIEGTSVQYLVQNRFLSAESFSLEKSNTLSKNPLKEGKEDKKEESFNLEEEVDFLDGYNLPTILFLTPIVKRQKKIVAKENFRVLFHPELLVPPPKA